MDKFSEPSHIHSRIQEALRRYHEHDDYDGCVSQLDEVIQETPSIDAVLVKAVIMGIEFGFFDEEVYKLLDRIGEDLPELTSMKHYLLANYYERDEQAIENHLRASIAAYDQHVNPYRSLGFHLYRKGEIKQAKQCLDRAIQNVVQILHIDDDHDSNNPKHFICEMIAGTCKESGNYQSMIEFRDFLTARQ